MPRACMSPSSVLMDGHKEFLNGLFAYYSQDHLTNVTWSEVGVSDPGSPGELDEVNVYFFWIRVY